MTEDVENQGVDNEAVKGRLKRWLIAGEAEHCKWLKAQGFKKA
jgi:hypothetical protein